MVDARIGSQASAAGDGAVTCFGGGVFVGYGFR